MRAPIGSVQSPPPHSGLRVADLDGIAQAHFYLGWEERGKTVGAEREEAYGQGWTQGAAHEREQATKRITDRLYAVESYVDELADIFNFDAVFSRFGKRRAEAADRIFSSLCDYLSRTRIEARGE